MAKFKWVVGIIIILALLIGSSAPFFTSISPAAAQDGEEFQLAPLNPDFIDFLEQPPEPFYGYIPPPMDLSHLKEIPVQREQALPTQPASWDWRDQGKVTPVGDQNPCGTCWVFGTTSVLESAVLLGESVGYDFSEQSVALCVDRSWVYLYDDADEPCNGGGWSWLASEVFIRKGAVLESCSPYNTSGLQCNGACVCDSCTPVKKVTGYRYVTGDGSQTALIKSAVYDRPVTMSYYHTESAEYTDPTYGLIYDCYPCTEDPDHLVSIIGWNNAVPHPNPAHSGTGAWLVKNSWGTGWGNSGYFWLAYDSSCMTDIAYLEYGGYNANETLYYWDEAGGLIGAVGTGVSSTLWGASVFTSTQEGNLTHVDFWTTSNNAEYELYVYDGSFGNQLAYQTNTCAELGYYSIPLTTPVSVTNGQQFTVAVKMTTPGHYYPIPVEEVISGFCEPPIQTGVCFLSTHGSIWEDAGDVYGWNVRLRAKITEPESPATSVSIEPSSQTVAAGGSFNVDVVVDSADIPITACNVVVTFDADLTATGLTGADLLGAFGLDALYMPTIDVGEVRYGGVRIDGPVAVDGDFVTIDFDVDPAAAGTYVLAIDATLRDAAGDPIAVVENDGQVNIVTNGKKGDFDGDGDIDFDDFCDFAVAYNSKLGDANYNEIGDFDGNGVIDFDDFCDFAAVYST